MPTRGHRFRATALLVAALFLGGIGGAADLDALLFHGAGAPGAATAHFESSGTTNHHADNCLLTLRVGSGRSAPPLVLSVRVEGVPQDEALRHRVTAPRSYHPGLHQDSRAPPAPLA